MHLTYPRRLVSRGELLVPQSHHGIDARRPPRRDESGKPGGDERTAVAAPTVHGYSPFTPKSIDDTKREAASAMGIPIATPMPIKTRTCSSCPEDFASHRPQRPTMPISLVRRATVYVSSPYRPTAASTRPNSESRGESRHQALHTKARSTCSVSGNSRVNLAAQAEG